MMSRAHNIEPVARAWCARDLTIAPGVSDQALPSLVDRYWPVVAAEIAAGLRDDRGNVIPHPIETGIRAWHEWLDDRR